MRPEFVAGNRLQLLNSGAEYFPALLAAIAEAEREIHLETYIFADDAIACAVVDALHAAARRGVAVRLLVDGFGTRDFSATLAQQLEAAGIQLLHFRPDVARFSLRRHRLRRLHRKLVVIDARLAFVGGINIVDDENAPPEFRPRFDYAVRVEGPLVQAIHKAVRRMWEMVAWVNIKHRFRASRPLPSVCPPAGEQMAAFLVRDNIRHRQDIAQAYLTAIRLARREILIANAYFLPGLRFRRALRQAAQRGVQVTLLLQGRSDHPLLHYAVRALYGALLHEGIRVFEYRKSFLHAKVAVVDGVWATVGSSNIDPFSLVLAKEANVVVYDQVFAAELTASLQQAMAAGAVELRAEELAHLSWSSRLRRWLSYGLVRLLVGLAGYGQQHDLRN